MRERGVHLHTLEDRDAEALQERGWWSRSLSDSDRGRIRSKHRTTLPPRSTHVRLERRLLLLDLARGEENLMDIQQHDGVVVELAVLR